MSIDVIQALAQFGVAGLMGMLWIGERALSRRREAQLDLAHARLRLQRGELKALVQLIERNSEVIARFNQTQTQLLRTMEKLNEHLHH